MLKKETLQSISERTGYSVSTVSRVLSGKGAAQRIAQSTIDAITEEARKCNYHANLLAKGLRTKHTNTVGLIVPSIENPYFSNLASVITTRLKECGYHLLLGDSMENEENEREIIESFAGQSVDGIIVVPSGSSPEILEDVAKGLPVLLVDRYFSETTLPYVSTDNYAGGLMATKHLLKKGYRNILAIQGLQSSMPNRERVRGFRDAICSHNEVSYSLVGDSFSIDNGYKCTLDALGPSAKGTERPDAIFAFSVTILLGAIKALRELGLSVPGDVGIISYDNSQFMDYLNPPVCRIAQPLQQMGTIAADILVRKIEKGAGQSDTLQLLVKPSLIEGESCTKRE